ncbi:hypothetical protein HJFPF1_06604 [Paramyrothecium foliicola]|nr:hypothetical protein HJFPF1_06604 [Paramyrothecium foliicola]
MPLHLLGKKSWNVYNADNVARVRRDEAAAKAAEEAEEQRMQEVDAQRRLAILRGEVPPPLPEAEEHQAVTSRDAPGIPAAIGRKKRKRPGEDDTDFELRIARERNELSVAPLEPTKKITSSAPIVDATGHIDLFGDERERAHAQKNEEAEKEARKKKKEFEDQYTMRFSNAAGRDGIQKPWYSEADLAANEPITKDVWGRNDPNRKDRASQRMAADDPLAMMKKGATKVRELKHERTKFQEEREAELKQLRREERHREKRIRRHERSERERSEGPRSPRRRHRSRDRREDGDRHRERSGRERERESGRRRRHGHSHAEADDLHRRQLDLHRQHILLGHVDHGLSIQLLQGLHDAAVRPLAQALLAVGVDVQAFLGEDGRREPRQGPPLLDPVLGLGLTPAQDLPVAADEEEQALALPIPANVGLRVDALYALEGRAGGLVGGLVLDEVVQARA